MKAKIIMFLVCSLIILSIGGIAFAEQSESEENTIAVMLDNLPLNLSTINYNNSLYIPLRDACGYFNCALRVDEKNKSIDILNGSGVTSERKPDKIVPLNDWNEKASKINKYLIKFNGIDTYLDSIYFSNKVYVPARYFGEIFNKKVEWNSNEKLLVYSSYSTYSVGSVNSDNIYGYEFNYFYGPQLKKMLADGSSKDASIVNKAKTDVFNLLVVRSLMRQEAAANNIVLDDNDLSNINTSIKALLDNYGGVYYFRKILKTYDVTLNQYIENIKDNYIFDKLNYQLTDKVEPSDDKINQYYNDNKASFLQEESIRAKHILILTTGLDDTQKEAAKKKAQGILDKINAGGDFDKLMRENSEDPGLKQYPDGYTFSRGTMVKEFEDAAFSLNVGQVSGLVESDYGYHIIKLEEKIPQKLLTLEEVRGEIIKALEPDAKQTYLDNLINQWKADSKIVNGV